MKSKQYPCYRLDPQTLERIEIIEDCREYDNFSVIHPDFDTLYALDETTIVENIVSQKEMEK